MQVTFTNSAIAIDRQYIKLAVEINLHDDAGVLLHSEMITALANRKQTKWQDKLKAEVTEKATVIKDNFQTTINQSQIDQFLTQLSAQLSD